jgi:hypothetical protein
MSLEILLVLIAIYDSSTFGGKSNCNISNHELDDYPPLIVTGWHVAVGNTTLVF